MAPLIKPRRTPALNGGKWRECGSTQPRGYAELGAFDSAGRDLALPRNIELS
jgi:hypothetical protein